MDTEAIETEDHSYDQVNMKMKKYKKILIYKTRNSINFVFEQSHIPLKASTIPAAVPQATSPLRVTFDISHKPIASVSTNPQMPSIAVTPTMPITRDRKDDIEVFQKPTIKVSPTQSDIIRRKSADPIEPIYSNM